MSWYDRLCWAVLDWLIEVENKARAKAKEGHA